MKNIFLRTLETTVRKSTIIISISIALFCGFLMTNIAEYCTGSFVSITNELLTYQNLFIFLAIDGLFLISMIAGSTSGVISSEVHEGTFRLLVTKPNSRSQILTGKLLGNFVGLIVLMMLSLFSYFTVIVLSGNIDSNIIKILLSYLPAYLLYGILVIVIIGSLACALSCICNKKLVAFLPIFILIIIIMAVIPMFRIIGEFSGGGQLPAVIDINYHFGLLFRQCIDLFGKSIPESASLGYFTNIFISSFSDCDITRSTWPSSVLTVNRSLSSIAVLVFYLILSAILIAVSYKIIQRKDV
ncbi:MAG: ABC transporter permease subunit [Erysipelotrichaceae bacterium]